MNETLPAPPITRDINVTEFPYMPLDVRRLLTSTTWIEAAKDGKLGHALICLWCESWQQIPAGSLPNNDVVLARLSMCEEETWNRIKIKAMDGFTLCSDDRFYHHVVIEKAVNAYNSKLARKERTSAAVAANKLKLEKRRNKRRK